MSALRVTANASVVVCSHVNCTTAVTYMRVVSLTVEVTPIDVSATLVLPVTVIGVDRLGRVVRTEVSATEMPTVSTATS